ncbi:class I SAM-dependent methyltransferase [soil metagenome]
MRMVPLPTDLPLGSLDLHADLARYYDLDMQDVADDIEMYQGLAQESGGPVLELAAGSGRVAIPLALAGHRIVALDNDDAMLERARIAWRHARDRHGAPDERLRFVDADLTSFRSDERFGLVILAQNVLLLMPDEAARLAALRTMSIHLRPGGLAVVDVSLPDADEMASWDGRLQLEWLRRDPESGDQVAKLISARLEPDASSVTLTQLFDATPPGGGAVRRSARVDTLNVIDRSELRSLAKRAGLGDVSVRVDLLVTPGGARSHRAILLGRLV